MSSVQDQEDVKNKLLKLKDNIPKEVLDELYKKYYVEKERELRRTKREEITSITKNTLNEILEGIGEVKIDSFDNFKITRENLLLEKNVEIISKNLEKMKKHCDAKEVKNMEKKTSSYTITILRHMLKKIGLNLIWKSMRKQKENKIYKVIIYKIVKMNNENLYEINEDINENKTKLVNKTEDIDENQLEHIDEI